MCCWNVEITKGNEEIFGANKSRKQLERQDKIQEFSYIVTKVLVIEIMQYSSYV